MTEIYEGPVRVFTGDKDGNAYVIKNGKRAGQPYCRISFQHNGETVYLPDFSNDAAGFDGQVCKVAYSQKVDAFGEPDLYNGNVQWNFDAIKAVGAPQRANAAPPAAQSGVTADDHKTTDIRRAVAVKAATEVSAALIGQGIFAEPLTFDFIGKVLTDAGRIVKWLETGEEPNEFDAMVNAAKALTDDPDGDGDSIPF